MDAMKNLEAQKLREQQAEQQVQQVTTTVGFKEAEEKRMQDARIMSGEYASPVMQNAMKIPVVLALDEPSQEAVKNAETEAKLKNLALAVKRGRRAKRAQVRYNRQQRLKEQQLEYYTRQSKSKEPVQKPFKTMLELMYNASGKLGDEKLVKNYEQIKDSLAGIEFYEKQLEEYKQQSGGGLSDEENDRLMRTEAKILTLKDMREFYSLHEALMSNEYYNLLPRGGLDSFDYEELQERLQRLYEPLEAEENAEGESAEVELNEELIDYYKNLIQLKELDRDFSDWNNVSSCNEQHYQKLKEK